jgi:tRNA wybutosine-synthesizing protein 1
MDQEYRKLLEKQGYGFIGEHSALKICGWTKKSIRDEGVCYKEKFYGIRAHRCIQMTPAVNFCDMDCVYCWRDRNNSPFGKADDPKEMLDKSIIEQERLLNGFGGLDKANKDKLKEAFAPMHVAISLNGEPTYYPKISELIKEIHNRGWSSFLVTNGQLPEVLEKIELPTQLYISLDSPTEDIHKKITRAKRKDSWERLMKSLDVMKKFKEKTRTTLRLTIIKGLNDVNPEGYAKLFDKADPTFIEVKAYMFVGASRQRLLLENMPRHHEVKEFAEEICKYCDYKIIDEQEASRVILLMKQDFDGRIMKWDD